jgi:DNA invertase Pin-like site-specific DNA recombinase
VAFAREHFYAREPILYLLVMDLDRFLRRDSLSTGWWLEELRKHGLRYIVTTAQRYDLHNQLDRTLIALSSDFTREPELRARSNHTLNGMADRARKGLWMGGPIPLGYRTTPALDVPPSRKGEQSLRLTLGPEEEQEVVRWIFTTYASGRLTAHGIARALTARGVPTRWARGKGWSRNTVLKIITSRVYLGEIVWGEQPTGKYHSLKGGMVEPRQDKPEREQAQLLRKLKHLPARTAAEEDCIVKANAHPALIDRPTWEACQARREDNRGYFSAPRCGLKSNVWPLAGQLKCGHCAAPVWVTPISGEGGKRKGTFLERARVCCSRRRCAGKERTEGSCPDTAPAAYLEVLDRVIALLQKKLGDPGAVAEMEREYARQLKEQAKNTTAQRRRLEDRGAALDRQIATATRNLLAFPEDLRADAFEALRGLKAERDDIAAQVRDLDAQAREAQPFDREEFNELLQLVGSLKAALETREEAEQLRATLRDLVLEVRLYFRPRRQGDRKPPRGIAPARVLRRVEVDLTPMFADLLTMGSRNSTPPRRS